MTAPVITSVYLAAGPGSEMVAVVEWTAQPRGVPVYQWFLAGQRIIGATASTFTGVADECRITIDNGRGVAIAYAAMIVAPDPDPGDPDPDPEAPESTLLGFADDAPLLGWADDAPLEIFADA